MHKVPNQNRFFRIYKNGTVLYSMRLTVTAKCPMNLRYFPLDRQLCAIEIESCNLLFTIIQIYLFLS